MVAFAAVGFSLLAVIAVCITMPIVYNFVIHIQQQTKHELDLCKVSVRYSRDALGLIFGSYVECFSMTKNGSEVDVMT